MKIFFIINIFNKNNIILSFSTFVKFLMYICKYPIFHHYFKAHLDGVFKKDEKNKIYIKIKKCIINKDQVFMFIIFTMIYLI